MSAFAAATGVGSWPGTSPRQAAEVIVGDLHALPHVVELPARGVGADMIGRAGARVVDRHAAGAERLLQRNHDRPQPVGRDDLAVDVVRLRAARTG